MSKQLLVAFAVATCVLGGSAVAADLPMKAPPPVIAPVFSWTGWYVGVTGGGAWGSSDASTSTVFSPVGYFAASSVPAIAAVGAQHINSSGGTVGGEFGYNWQSGRWVYGLETDIEWVGLSGSVTGSALYPCCAPTGFTVTSSVKTDWLWTLRPRLGLAADHWLFYVTGGLAVGNVKANYLFTDTFAAANESATISRTKAGWVAGLGAEYALGGSWSAKIEYLHVDLGRVTVSSTNLTAFAPPIAFPTNVFTHSINLHEDIVRAGLNFRL